ncbi:MAG: transposase, partial [Methylacidiphilales bacterium]|nr:transposase [Candidatus Methylacidiphilales bacterium]
MRGRQQKQQPLFVNIRLEEMVPGNHLLRRIERKIDFNFIDQKTQDLYSTIGRPSIDPQVLVRMMFIGYLFGIHSERRLCQEVHLNLAYRWFCGLGLEDKVPDHSTFTKNRHGRFAGTTLFRDLFYAVVDQALARGLIQGRHLSVDATTMQANASLDSLEPIVVPMSAEGYWQEVEAQNPVPEENPPDPNPDSKTDKPKISNATHRSQSAPQARLFAKRFEKTRLPYSDNVLMDNGSRFILDVEVTEPNVHQEGQAAASMVQRSRFRLKIDPQSIGG